MIDFPNFTVRDYIMCCSIYRSLDKFLAGRGRACPAACDLVREIMQNLREEAAERFHDSTPPAQLDREPLCCQEQDEPEPLGVDEFLERCSLAADKFVNGGIFRAEIRYSS